VSGALRATVIVATFNRRAPLARLLGQLATQTVTRESFEVVVVDDGSAEPVRSWLDTSAPPFPLVLLEQPNSGPAIARHRGAEAASGEVLVFVDDDMQVGPGFLAAHLDRHLPGMRNAVLGRIRPPEDPGAMVLCERWHQHHLDRLAERSGAGEPLPGNALYTGNLSLRREDYVSVGGFDLSYRQVEDAELGLRLEKAGLTLTVAEDAWSVNAGDRPTAERWRRRARTWGELEHRIAAKHRDVRHASPWRYLGISPRAARPLLLGAALVPAVAGVVARSTYALAAAADWVGLERLAFSAAGLTFQLEYFRGVRAAAGGARDVLREAARWVSNAAVRSSSRGA
jgi:glycosyltransferase involved in cell wall biosynthesis